MATLESTIVLTDKMSPVLEKLQRQARYMMDALEKMNKASKNPIDPKGFEAAQQEMRETDAAIISLKEDMEKLNQQSRNTGKGMKGFGGIVQGMIQGVGMGISNKIMGAFSLDTVKSIAATSDAMVSVNAKVKMLTKSEDEFNELQDKIRKSAKASRSEYMETAEAVANLGMLAGDAFSNNDEIIKFTEAVGKSFTLSGADAGTKAGATRQLVQALGSGVLRGDELNSIMEGAPIIVEMIAKKLGVTKGEIRQLAAEGKLTGEVVKSAMIDGLDEINDRYAKMPATWESVSADLKNQMLYAFQPALDMVNDIANSERFNQLVEAAGPRIKEMGLKCVDVLERMMKIGGWMIKNWTWLKPIVMGVAGYFTTMKLVSMYMAVTALPSMIAQMGTIAGLSAATAASLNIAAGAIGLVVGGIALAMHLNAQQKKQEFMQGGDLTDADYKEYKKLAKKDKGKRDEIDEKYLRKANQLASEYGGTSGFIIKDPIYKHKKAMLQKEKEMEIAKLPSEVFKEDRMFENRRTRLRMEQTEKDADDAQRKAEQYQKDTDKQLNDLKNGMGGAGTPPSSPKPPKYEQQKQNTLDKIAKDTGAMRKRMELSESDMELIRKLATRQIVAKGTSAKIQIINNNTINNQADYNAFTRKITNDLTEMAQVSMAGG